MWLNAIMARGGVTERLMVPLSKSGVGFAHRGFESHPLRQTVEPLTKNLEPARSHRFWVLGSRFCEAWRGAGVADQARLESV